MTAQSVRATRVRKFIEKYIVVPEGILVGKPMVLLPEQTDYIDAVYNNVGTDGVRITRRGVFSVARKNGKSGMIAALVGAHLIGPEAVQNSRLNSAGRSRDQAALVFNYLAKSLRLRNDLHGLVEIVDSVHTVRGLAIGTEYKAISADATTAFGLSPALSIHDELGQVIGPTDKLYDAMETAGGAHAEPLTHIISTQAASDADLLSTIIDDAIRNPTPETVVRVYAAAKDADIFDERVWYEVNFAMGQGKFRNEKEFREAAARAARMPAFEATFRNLFLNQRVSLLTLYIAPSVWGESFNVEYLPDLFSSGEEVHMAADLSQNKDLTCVAFACKDPETKRVHLRIRVYTPLFGLEMRAKIDRIDYTTLVKQGWLQALPGRVIDYDMVVQDLKEVTKGMNIAAFHFDRWRMDVFRKACVNGDYLTEYDREDVVATDEGADPQADTDKFWRPVGQGYRDMSPRLDNFESLLLNEQLAHEQNPLLTAAVAGAIAVQDPAKNRKLEKVKSSARIDPLVAAVMAAYGFAEYVDNADKGPVEVTEDSFSFV